MNKDWYLSPAKEVDAQAVSDAETHQAQLTKPQGSLGQLEELAIKFAGWQGQAIPCCKNILIRVFAGDHGICKDRVDEDGIAQANVSAFPQSVTAQMIHNFINGGAAINVLAKQLDADFAVVNMGTVEPIQLTAPHLVTHQLMNGTNDFTQEPAMSEDVLQQALQAGHDEVINQNVDLFIGGEMGIGNTTSASAIYSLLMKVGPEATVGVGTGVDKDGVAIKRKVIYQAINRHGEFMETPLSILRHVGGLEIAALVGAIIAAAQNRTPVLVDGFICTAAALLAVKLNPSVREWLLFSHKSAEKAHEKALTQLQARPLLDLDMRLGEGSGSAIAVPIIQNALALHSQMATFEEASISSKGN